MEERPPKLPDVWEGEEISNVDAAPKSKTAPVKMVDLGPLGEHPQKIVMAV